MSDRVILMRWGRIVQEGEPRELFDRPASRFVADFMGVENIFQGRLADTRNGRAIASVGSHALAGAWCGRQPPAVGQDVFIGVRAERVRLAANGARQPDGVSRITCRPATTIYKGKYLDQSLETDFGTIKARIWDSSLDVAQIDGLWWAEKDCMIMPDLEGSDRSGG